jgi:hypothetical protein
MLKMDVDASNNIDATEEPCPDATATPNPDITVINSIKENYLSWVCILISVFTISYPNYIKGYGTFFLMMILGHLSHYGIHFYRNILTILHHYHHENNNFFSHFIQILLEIAFVLVFAPFYFIYGTIFLDEWVLLLFVIFYSTVHNINYGIFRVNKVHSLHHQNIFTNMGPDICDILFRTKNKQETNVENTDHYIPNIIIGTIIVLFLQKLYKNDANKPIMIGLLKLGLATCFIVTFISSIYIWFFNSNKR